MSHAELTAALILEMNILHIKMCSEWNKTDDLPGLLDWRWCNSL